MKVPQQKNKKKANTRILNVRKQQNFEKDDNALRSVATLLL